VRRWVSVVLWLVVIALFSTGVASQSATEGPLTHLLRSTWPAAFTWLERTAWPDVLSFIVRKGAHLFEYGVLALLVVRALRYRPTMPAATAMVTAIGVCALVASADELHQTLVASRTGSLADVGIDVAGATAALIWLRVRRAKAGRG
jgi:VanZ family protein